MRVNMHQFGHGHDPSFPHYMYTTPPASFATPLNNPPSNIAMPVMEATHPYNSYPVMAAAHSLQGCTATPPPTVEPSCGPSLGGDHNGPCNGMNTGRHLSHATPSAGTPVAAGSAGIQAHETGYQNRVDGPFPMPGDVGEVRAQSTLRRCVLQAPTRPSFDSTSGEQGSGRTDARHSLHVPDSRIEDVVLDDTPAVAGLSEDAEPIVAKDDDVNADAACLGRLMSFRDSPTVGGSSSSRVQHPQSEPTVATRACVISRRKRKRTNKVAAYESSDREAFSSDDEVVSPDMEMRTTPPTQYAITGDVRPLQVGCHYESMDTLRETVQFVAFAKGFQYKRIRSHRTRPLIVLDGDIRGKYECCLLGGTARDANGQCLPVVYAVVDAENQKNWKWFLVLLKRVCDAAHVPHGIITIMSDRDKGLIPAVSEEFGDERHVYCVRHVSDNLLKNLRVNREQAKMLLEVAQSTSEPVFDYFMQRVADFSKDKNIVKKIFAKADKRHWGGPHFHAPRYGKVTSQVAESMNNRFFRARGLPPIPLIEEYHGWLQKWYTERRDWAVAQVGEHPEVVEDILTVTLQLARIYSIRKAARRRCRTPRPAGGVRPSDVHVACDVTSERAGPTRLHGHERFGDEHDNLGVFNETVLDSQGLVHAAHEQEGFFEDEGVAGNNCDDSEDADDDEDGGREDDEREVDDNELDEGEDAGENKDKGEEDKESEDKGQEADREVTNEDWNEEKVDIVGVLGEVEVRPRNRKQDDNEKGKEKVADAEVVDLCGEEEDAEGCDDERLSQTDKDSNRRDSNWATTNEQQPQQACTSKTKLEQWRCR
ncbi:hypothetical protein CBR_g8176 [Chara braunii]|uniref:MULE transposase domain-containing protein n=1 Tax=Chara braunii TaxID=69332 RepID=A0A388KLF2_CHABU|nr:hypothetical protein CBR_g8176 [Chara braunii]|eukprot:GBG70876.1 hypothetical protein CBR_g8176 [Chara braunii]